jgi:ammonia channel protein AmtB
MYTRVFRPRLIWTIILSVVVQVFLYAAVFHYVWEANAPRFLEWERDLQQRFLPVTRSSGE